MEKISGILIVLFILSLVSERIANFFKLKLSDTRLLLKSSWIDRLIKPFTFNNTKIKTFDPVAEKDREFRVLKINIVIGFLVALSFRADLFCFFRNLSGDSVDHMGWIRFKADSEPLQEFLKGWPAKTLLVYLYTILGCFLTGVFLSFGSKFWHDLIDLVLQIKNYKTMLTREGVQKLEQQFSGLETDQQETLIDQAIKLNYQSWKSEYPNIIGCTSSLKTVDGSPQPKKAIVFKVKTKETLAQLAGSKPIPPMISFNGLSIPTDVIEARKPRTLQIQYPGDNYFPSLIGTNVSLDLENDFGTVGLKVRRGKKDFLLSCCHVFYLNDIGRLSPVTSSNRFLSPKHLAQTKVTIPSAQYRAGQNNPPALLEGYAVEGLLSHYVDAAICEISTGSLDNKSFFYSGAKQRKVKGELDYYQIKKGLEVEIFGCVSGLIKGTVDDLAQRTEVEMVGPGYSFDYQFDDLIVVKASCLPGDSGAPVLTGNGEVVGILAAGDADYAYVIPFLFIKNNLKITL